MAVSQNEAASAIGAEILRTGGNAVDAAVATAFAPAVTLPRAGNIGGDGFMLVHLVEEGRTVAIDYRSAAPAAPAAATLDAYLDDEGRIDGATAGYKAAGACPAQPLRAVAVGDPGRAGGPPRGRRAGAQRRRRGRVPASGRQRAARR
ncbi:gamma-glutamyltransferase [Luteimonas sp. R10]|uniref:gamma-glutamyltransferase n=1 Tax=Luteimonas sp. R10 TaxID=3108176 RepID=UPI0030880AED|nr:gamma-glutamyltransferase [Luteimonas sp. R10]